MLPGGPETPNPTCSPRAWIIYHFSSLCGPAATLGHLTGFDNAGVKGGDGRRGLPRKNPGSLLLVGGVEHLSRQCPGDPEREGTADSYLGFTTSGSPTILTSPCCFRC